MVHDADIATSGDAAIFCSNMVESDFCNIQVKYFQTIQTSQPLLCQTEAGDVGWREP